MTAVTSEGHGNGDRSCRGREMHEWRTVILSTSSGHLNGQREDLEKVVGQEGGKLAGG